MSVPQVYQAFVNGGFREVVLVKEAAPWLPCNMERVNTGLSGGGTWGLEAYKAHAAKLQNELNAALAQIAAWQSHGYPSERLTAVEAKNTLLLGNNDRQAETIKRLMEDIEELEDHNRIQDEAIKIQRDAIKAADNYVAESKRTMNLALDTLGNVL